MQFAFRDDPKRLKRKSLSGSAGPVVLLDIVELAKRRKNETVPGLVVENLAADRVAMMQG